MNRNTNPSGAAARARKSAMMFNSIETGKILSVVDTKMCIEEKVPDQTAVTILLLQAAVQNKKMCQIRDLCLISQRL